MDALEDAQHQLDVALHKSKVAYEAQVDAETKSREEVLSERQLWWERVAKGKAKAQSKLENERRGFGAIISHLQQKHSTEVDRLNTKISDHDTIHRQELKDFQRKLDRQKDLLHEEKQRRRRMAQKAADIKAQCLEHVEAMDLWLMDTATELKVCCNDSILFCFPCSNIYIIACSLSSNVGSQARRQSCCREG
jgi:hypothetical protein